MAWTAPSTWVAGAVLTAAQLNQQVRDNFKAIGDPWVSYTPTHAWTLGNGVRTAKYMQAGKFVWFSFSWTQGSTSVASGTFTFSLPVTPSITSEYHPFGQIGINDVSAAGAAGRRFYVATWQTSSSSIIGLDASNGAALTQLTPFTIATGDIIRGQGFYEAA